MRISCPASLMAAPGWEKCIAGYSDNTRKEVFGVHIPHGATEPLCLAHISGRALKHRRVSPWKGNAWACSFSSAAPCALEQGVLTLARLAPRGERPLLVFACLMAEESKVCSCKGFRETPAGQKGTRTVINGVETLHSSCKSCVILSPCLRAPSVCLHMRFKMQ